MSGDYADDPRFKAWVGRVRRELIPKLESSAVTVSLVPEGEWDVKFAVELGLSIQMNKPIVAVVRPGVHVPEKLSRVVDRWIEGDMTTDAGARSIAERLQQILQEMDDDS